MAEPSSILLGDDTLDRFTLCDAHLLGGAWESEGRDLHLRLRDGSGRAMTLRCTWVSAARFDLTWPANHGGPPVTWECRCERLGARWRLCLDFASTGSIVFECNEARLEFDSGEP